MKHPARRRLLLLSAVLTLFALALPMIATADGDILELVPNTSVLLAKISSTSTGGGGNGGNTSSASNATNIFAPASYVDYHQIGGEPTTVVDRYPFASSFACQVAPGSADNESGCQSQAKCPIGQTSCYHDQVYVSNPLGLGEYSEFYKSSDGGQSFRVPPHNPYFFDAPGLIGSGGGDSHQAVGDVTHSVFFVDLSGVCVTMNVSRDLGETWIPNDLGCAANPGAIDDRQWVATDETAPGSTGGAVYVTFNNDSGAEVANDATGASIVLVKSNNDGGANTPADWNASTCNAFGAIAESPGGAPDNLPTACPDPNDPHLWISGPIAVDKSAGSPNDHSLYIPFERVDGTSFSLWVAISRDEGDSWTRHLVETLGPRDPANIFPQLTIDTAGNLYYTWSQAQGLDQNTPANEGETDVYYTFSQGAGLEGTWAAPVNITKENGDSAVFPWMVAGSPGQVDLVLYKSNSGLNPNAEFLSPSGQPDTSCSAPSASCIGNTSVWNTYFGQSQNALNTGANFKLVQISDHPIHLGGVCTQGIACGSSQYQNRDLLDFLTVDFDHTGAAYVTWADDNNARQDTRQFFSRQLSGNSILARQNIAAMNAYPITDHAVTDQGGDVTDAAGLPADTATCPPGSGMDVLGTTAKQSSGLVTVTLTLDGAPTFAHAVTCSREPGSATGALWGAEFWGAASATAADAPGNDNFYIAYRDNPPDAPNSPGVEAGRVNALSVTLNKLEFQRIEQGALGGTCLTAAGTPNPAAPTPCTLVLTAPLSGLGIKPGAALDSISGMSIYVFGAETTFVPGTRVPLGNTNQADAATPFDDNGTGTTK
jgi:hypothetical protein